MFNGFRNAIRKQDTKQEALAQVETKYPRPLMARELDYLASSFDKQPMRPEGADRLAAITKGAKEFSTLLMQHGAPTAELQEALDAVRQAQFWALESVKKGRYHEEKQAAMAAKMKEASDGKPGA